MHCLRNSIYYIFATGIGITIMLVNYLYIVYFLTLRAWICEYLVTAIRHSILPWTHCNNTWNTPSCDRPDMNILKTSGNDTSFAVYDSINATSSTSPEEEFWSHKVHDISSGIDDIGSFNWTCVLYVVVLRGLIVLSLVKNIKSLEKVIIVSST